MVTQLKEEFEIPDKLKDIYRKIEVSPVGILRNYALNLIHSKIQKYEAESAFYEKKHGCKLEKFRVRVEDLKEQENFEWEDDLKDWEFASINLKYWQEKLLEIQGE